MFVDLLILSAAAAALVTAGFFVLAARHNSKRVSASSKTYLREITLPAQFRQTPSEGPVAETSAQPNPEQHGTLQPHANVLRPIERRLGKHGLTSADVGPPIDPEIPKLPAVG